MKLARRKFLQWAAGAAALLTAPGRAAAQAYPTRPVRLIVGFPPGTATDADGRLVAQWLSERLGQQVIVDNRTGASTNIAAESVVRADPDGYTLLMITVTNAVNATLYRKLNFDLVRDIPPVAGTMLTANVLVVNPDVPAHTVPEFIAYLKAHPGKVNYASNGHGSAPNMAAELFKSMTGTDMVHVPYRSSMTPDLIAGQVQVAFTPIPLSIAFIRDGKLRALAVTGAKRSDALPGIPTVAEFVPGYQADVWHGVGAPKDTPADIIARLNKEIGAALVDPGMIAKFANLGAEPMPMTPAEFGQFIAAEIDKWGKVVRFAGVTLD
ncbi:MAG: tripartite tricarboxylate transporter substrate binding protein [Hyphomicrobiales bacterium]|nr:tripartite tricarboxylate transporter substrate binding protein [Hyphomicrobiales bacterium]